MKHLLSILVVFLLLALPAVALAQTGDSPLPTPTPVTGEQPPQPPELPDELPPTAEEALQVIGVFVTFLSALATYYVTRWIRMLPLLNDGEKSKLVGLAADAVAGVMAFVSFGVLAYGGLLAGLLDENGFWAIIRWVWLAWPASWTFHKVRKVGKEVFVPVIETQ